MKRTVQMARAGTASARQRSKFKGFRGVGSRNPITGQRRQWREGEPVHVLRPVRKARLAAEAAARAEAEAQASDKLKALVQQVRR